MVVAALLVASAAPASLRIAQGAGFDGPFIVVSGAGCVMAAVPRRIGKL